MTVNVTIFTSSPVAGFCWNNFNGDEYKAAKVAKLHLEATLDHWSYDHNVVVGNDTTYEVQKSTMEKELSYFDTEWLDGHSEKSSNANLMLLDNKPDGPAGLADTPGDAGLKKFATDMAYHRLEADWYGDPSYDDESRIRGSIHEIGHNFGMVHCDGRRYDTNGTTYATPHGCEIDGTLQSENNCGRSCSQNSIEMFDHYYSNCEENEI